MQYNNNNYTFHPKSEACILLLYQIPTWILMSNVYSKIFEWSQKLNLNCLALLLWVSSWVSCLVLSQTKPSLSSVGALSKCEDLLMRISHFVPSSSPITPCVSCSPLCSPGWELPSQHANHIPCLQKPLLSTHCCWEAWQLWPVLEGRKKNVREGKGKKEELYIVWSLAALGFVVVSCCWKMLWAGTRSP